MRRWFRRRPRAGGFREEVEIHLAMRAEHDGSDHNAACRRFGNTLRIEEQMRRVWIGAFWDTLLQDIRYTWRTWIRNPGFAVTAVLVFALGLGASTAFFSVLDRILFRSPPYPDADRLVSVGFSKPPFPTEMIPERGYREYWHPAPYPFESIATISGSGIPCDVTEQSPERLGCARVEASLLDVLRRPVLLGRNFTAEDDRAGAPPVALISHVLWTRRFGQSPDVVGRNLNLNGSPVRIVGVLPPVFEMPLGKADVLLPQQFAPLDPKGTATRFLWGIARLRPGTTIEQARAVARIRLQGMLEHLSPRIREQANFVVRPLMDRQVGDASRTAQLLLGAVAMLLLIACFNVANLLFARIASQDYEFAVRSAIGAGKPRLVRLALTESLLLAIAGGAAGLLIASLLLKLIVAMAPAGIPKIDQATLDTRVFVVATALALISGILVGLWPAAAVWRHRALQGLRNTITIKPRARLIMVSAQIALTVTMMGGSALFLRTLWKMAGVPLGFETDGIVTLSATLNRARYPEARQRALFFENLMERARRIPGVLSATLSDAPPPLGVAVTLSSIAVDGHPVPKNETGPDIRQRIVTPQYFETFGIPVRRGRAFNSTDGLNHEPAAILSEAAAKILFPRENPIGRRIKPQPMYPWHIVVGVVGDIRNMGLTSRPQPELYMVRSNSSLMWVPSGLTIRSTMRPEAAAALLRQLAADLDPELPVEIQSLDRQVTDLSGRPRFIAWLLTAFAIVALVIASSGLYGVASYLVAQRTRDFGIRIAMGARPIHILSDLAGESALWIVAGMLLGIPLAWTGGKAIQSQLFGIEPTDAISWSIALLALFIGLALSLLRPFIRALHINPIDTLRVE